MTEVERQHGPRRLLLVGWDAADWKVIRPLLAAGQMPALQSLIDRGVSGDITTLQPALSPMLWTSIATGKRPFKHGVLGFAEPDPATGGIRGVTSLARRGKAVWNILNQNGFRTNVIGWWPSHPAEPINGVMVSNHYHEAAGTPATWTMARGVVYPERLGPVLKERRVHPDDVVSSQVLAFAPKLSSLTAADIRSVEHDRILALKQCIARAASIQAAARAVIDAEPWDFMAVYFDAIDHFGHGFMRYHPPRQEWIPARDFDLYGDVVNAAYRFHDTLLGELLRTRSVTSETTVLVLSDHGFHCDHLRVTHLPRAATGPALEHRDLGIRVACGPGIRTGTPLRGASVIDVTPTILTLFGLPAGEDMDGSPLASMFIETADLSMVPSWDEVPEAVPGAAGMHAPDRRIEPAECKAALAQLIALGYVESPTQDAAQAVARTTQQAQYDLALSWMDADGHGHAIPILAALWTERPLDHRVGLQLAHALAARGRTDQQRRVLETVIARRQAQADTARKEIAELTARGSRADALTLQARTRYAMLRPLAAVDAYATHVLMASACHAEGDHAAALEHLTLASRDDAGRASLHILTGRVCLALRRWADAERCFTRALAIDADAAEAYLGLAESFLPRRRNLDAVNAALCALERRFYFPLAHVRLGVALGRIGRVPLAMRAFEVAIAQNPALAEAHTCLAALCRSHFVDRERAAGHLRAARRVRATLKRRLAPAVDAVIQSAIGAPVPARVSVPATATRTVRRAASLEAIGAPITVVSGLPRSGTSMMMRMLAAGGLAPLTDAARVADSDNPHGYFEFAPARRLREDASWLPQAAGRAVKIVAQLLTSLPTGPQYKVLFMRRDLDEVLASQKVMLRRTGQAAANIAPERLRAVFAAQMQEVERALGSRPGVITLSVDYRDAVRSPLATAARVNAFLGGALDEPAMAAAVDATLWRQRT